MNKKIEKILKNQGENYIFPFFWLHGESEETLRKYMRVINESNIGAVCVESRPHPDYCGEKWWKDMDIILDEARRRNMKVWILDDSHFPTGYANGAMSDQPDELCRQSICCRIYEPENGILHIGKEELLHPDQFVKTMVENYTMEKEPRIFDDDRLLALYAVRCSEGKTEFEKEEIIDLKPLICGEELKWKIPEGKWKVYAIHLSRNQGYHRSYINMMDRESCRTLIDAVYEPHYAHYAKDFGTTIAGFFSDEPELGNGHMYEWDDAFGTSNDFPWSRELEKELEQRLGKEYSQFMGLLWETDADPALTAKVRYTYMDAVTKLVKADFSEQIGTWCREHGVKYIGHLIEDNNHHTRTGSSLGHYFRGLAGQDMAGIDDIGGQVFPQGEDVSYDKGTFQRRNGEFYHYVLAKLGSSAAAIEPRKKGNSMCEIFGNYGWEEGVRLEKYLADHFLVRGINHYVPHAFSPKEFPDPDCPPHFYAGGHNPQYRHFGYLMAYMNRVCELISDGRHAAPIAVIYHAEGEWTGKYITMDKICHALSDSQLEYDIVPQDVFTDRESFRTVISGGKLKVNMQEYRTVIVPYMQYITKEAAAALTELSEQNGTVVFVKDYPEGYCDADLVSGNIKEEINRLKQKTKKLEVEELPAFMKKMGNAEVELSPADNRIRYIRYIHEDGTTVYMFVNEGTETWKGKINFLKEQSEKKSVYEYDAWENNVYSVEQTENEIELEIEPLKSRIVVFDSFSDMDQHMHKTKLYAREEMEQIPMQKNWKRSVCKSIDYPKFTNEKEISLPDKLAEEEPEFSGFVRYASEFEADQKKSYFLEITDAGEGVEVFVNGRSLGIQIVPTYWFDLNELIQPGRNSICIEVATTLEREMAVMPDLYGQKKQPKALSGIMGEVRVLSCCS